MVVQSFMKVKSCHCDCHQELKKDFVMVLVAQILMDVVYGQFSKMEKD